MVIKLKLYHFTAKLALPAIWRCAQINCTGGIEGVWLTSNPAATPDAIRWATVHNLVHRTKVRIEVEAPVETTFTWKEHLRQLNPDHDITNTVNYAAQQYGAATDDWFVCAVPIGRDCWRRIAIATEQGEYKEVWPNFPRHEFAALLRAYQEDALELLNHLEAQAGIRYPRY
jgi:hypothetical protein